MAQLKGGSKITGDLAVTGKVYVSGDTTDISTKVQNNYNKIINMLGQAHTFASTIEAANGSTNCETGNAILMGNSLRVWFKLTLASAATGNVDNIKMGTLTVPHGGKIKDAYAIGFNDYGYGGQVAMYTGAITNGTTTLPINLNLAATMNSTTTINSYFVVPVTLDPAYF
jgi:hypothetical protein